MLITFGTRLYQLYLARDCDWSWSSASRASTRVLAMEFEDAVWREGSPHPEEGCLRFWRLVVQNFSSSNDFKRRPRRRFVRLQSVASMGVLAMEFGDAVWRDGGPPLEEDYDQFWRLLVQNFLSYNDFKRRLRRSSNLCLSTLLFVVVLTWFWWNLYCRQ